MTKKELFRKYQDEFENNVHLIFQQNFSDEVMQQEIYKEIDEIFEKLLKAIE